MDIQIYQKLSPRFYSFDDKLPPLSSADVICTYVNGPNIEK